MKKTTKKLSLGMKIASILACLAIVSVGFASWWIIQYPETDTITEGSFEVYKVETKKITFENVTFIDGAEITYGYTDADTTYNWLGADKFVDAEKTPNGVKPEKLSSTLQFTVQLDDENGNIDEYINTVKVDFDAGAAYETAMSANAELGNVVAVGTPTVQYRFTAEESFTNEQWKNAPAYTTENNTSITFTPPTDCGAKLLVQVKITFAWGGTTGGENPYEYYNNIQYSDGKALEAANFINAVKTLNAQQAQAYKITISTDPGRPEATN